MKTSTLLLGGSLVLNAALIVAAVIGSATDSTPVVQADSAAAAVTVEKTTNAAPGPETWTNLQSDDLTTQIGRLRAEGFPPALVRAIISAQIRESFAGR